MSVSLLLEAGLSKGIGYRLTCPVQIADKNESMRHIVIQLESVI